MPPKNTGTKRKKRRNNISEATVATLIDRYQSGAMELSRIAKDLGIHIDTAKRILNKHNVRPTSNSKHFYAPSPKKWTRPCLRCRCTKPRPKHLYICPKCKLACEVNPTRTDDDFKFM